MSTRLRSRAGAAATYVLFGLVALLIGATAPLAAQTLADLRRKLAPGRHDGGAPPPEALQVRVEEAGARRAQRTEIVAVVAEAGVVREDERRPGPPGQASCHQPRGEG